MTDSELQDVIPYSDEWLRERGARFNPLTDKPVPQITEIKPESRAPTSPSGAATPLREPEVLESLPPQPAASPTISPQAQTRGVTAGGTEEVIVPEQQKMPRRRPSRLPLIIGFLLAVAAVIVAEQYLVPMFTHPKKVTRLAPAAQRPSSPSSSTPAVPLVPKISESQTPPTAKVIPSTSMQQQTPKSIPPVRQVEESVAPRPTVPVAATPPAVTQAPTTADLPSTPPPAENEMPNSPRAAPPPQRESKAQFEQQHMQQLLSPLG